MRLDFVISVDNDPSLFTSFMLLSLQGCLYENLHYNYFDNRILHSANVWVFVFIITPSPEILSLLEKKKPKQKQKLFNIKQIWACKLYRTIPQKSLIK